MAYIIGMVLMLLGLALGIIGEREGSELFLTIGGCLITAGVATVLLRASATGGRKDEPDGHIRP